MDGPKAREVNLNEYLPLSNHYSLEVGWGLIKAGFEEFGVLWMFDH